jgi:hypothetical protein
LEIIEISIANCIYFIYNELVNKIVQYNLFRSIIKKYLKRGESTMEMRKEYLSETEQRGQVLRIKKTGNFIDDAEEIYNFLHYDCYSVPDISINNETKCATNLAWIRRNIDIDLSHIQNIKYINNNRAIEIKYLNGDIIIFFAD